MLAARAKAYAKWALAPARDYLDFRRLPVAAKEAVRADAAGPPQFDPGAETAIAAALDWLGRAQDLSRSNDGGVARHYSLTAGWGTSYPETTGYIVPTLLEQAALRGDPALRERARRALDWLVSIQFPEGGFQGGTSISSRACRSPSIPARSCWALRPAPRNSAIPIAPRWRRAADWLANSQDADGCWRKYRTPFAKPDDKTYETHVSWGLFEAARAGGNPDWGEAGLRQVRWALTKQHANGWMESCCLSDPSSPLTHTLGYALRGILEAWRYSQSDDFLAAGRRLGDGLLAAQQADGSLPGELKSDWSPGAPWVCLTGLVQIAHGWLILFGRPANQSIGMPRWPRTPSCGEP